MAQTTSGHGTIQTQNGTSQHSIDELARSRREKARADEAKAQTRPLVKLGTEQETHTEALAQRGREPETRAVVEVNIQEFEALRACGNPRCVEAGMASCPQLAARQRVPWCGDGTPRLPSARCEFGPAHATVRPDADRTARSHRDHNQDELPRAVLQAIPMGLISNG
ncbi:MAG: hypothetical protein OXC13_07160 [Caldilineaceae bacterium]|nr:hypothetical protein [Caldilineaceae bacterium]